MLAVRIVTYEDVSCAESSWKISKQSRIMLVLEAESCRGLGTVTGCHQVLCMHILYTLIIVFALPDVLKSAFELVRGTR